MQISSAAATAPAPAIAPADTESVVWLVTIGPGDDFYEKFGHNFILFRNVHLIRDPQSRVDRAFNWGIYDFGEGWKGQFRFILNFIQGRLQYLMTGEEDWEGDVASYAAHDRMVWAQELNLSPGQIESLLNYCQWKDQPGPGHREYLYDYFIKNCSTEARDALDLAVGGQIKRRASTMPSPLTYRSETNRLMSSNPVLYPSLDFVLGHPTDRKMTAWEEMFIPMRMRERFNSLTILDESGREAKLVRREIILNHANRTPERAQAPRWWAWFLLTGVVIGGAMVGLARRESRRAKRGFGALAVFWGFFSGFAGCVLIHFWAFTDHIWVRPNENILQMSPILLPMVVLVPLALRGWKKPLRIGRILALIALAASGLGLILKVLPMMDQVNSNIIALALPANAGMAWALWNWRWMGMEGKAKGTKA